MPVQKSLEIYSRHLVHTQLLDMTWMQHEVNYLSRVEEISIQSFPFPRLVVIPRLIYMYVYRGVYSLMLSILEHGHSSPSSKPGQGCLHFT